MAGSCGTADIAGRSSSGFGMADSAAWANATSAATAVEMAGAHGTAGVGVAAGASAAGNPTKLSGTVGVSCVPEPFQLPPTTTP